MVDKEESIDKYLAEVPAEHRDALKKLRAQINKLYPDATEHIRYSMPFFKLDGKSLGGFKATKNHSALYVWSDKALAKLSDILDGYDTAESTIRFDPAKPLPERIVKAVFDERVREIKNG